MSVQIKTEDGWKKVAGNINPSEIKAVNARLDEYEQSGYLPKNLFVKEKVVNGYYYNSSGALSPQSGWGYENIPINGGNSYTISNKGSISSNVQNVWLDSNGNFISIASSRGVASPYTVEAPNNAKYLGVSLIVNSALATYELDIFQVEKGTQATPYTPYAKSNVELTEIVDDAIGNNYITTNLIDSMILGRWISSSGSESSDSTGAISNLIEIEPNTQYTLSAYKGNYNMSNIGVVWYTNTKAFIERNLRNISDSAFHTFTSPSNAKYMVVITSNASGAFTQAELNDIELKAIKGGKYIPSNTELQIEIDRLSVATSKTITSNVATAYGTIGLANYTQIGNTKKLYLEVNVTSNIDAWGVVATLPTEARASVSQVLSISVGANRYRGFNNTDGTITTSSPINSGSTVVIETIYI